MKYLKIKYRLLVYYTSLLFVLEILKTFMSMKNFMLS